MSDPKHKQLNLIVSKLKGVMRSGAGLVALCPAHDDKTQSLSISWKEDGTVLLKCHAGCETEAVMAAIGLPMSALFPEHAQVPAPSVVPPSERVPVCTYDYVDEKGNLLSQVVRYEPKSFRQRRPDGEGGWIYNLEGVRRVLYRLPEFRKKNRTTAFVVEGEKDADRLWSLKLPTTTSLGGSSAWRPEYAEQLTAAKIERAVILPDNDGAGRKYAAKVAESLHAAGIAVKIVELPDLPEKGDVSDWLDAGHTKEELFDLVRAAKEWAPGAEPEPEPAPEPRKRLDVVSLDEVPEKDIEWLWEGRIPVGMLTLLAGDSGTGKSFLSEDIAARLSRGEAWPDGKANTYPPSVTIFLAAEDPLAEVTAPRMSAMGGDKSKVKVVRATVLVDGKQRMFSLGEDLEELRELVLRYDAKAVVVDPINAYLGGGKVDNYKDPEVRAVLTPLAQLADELRIAVIGIMHLSKAAQAQVLYRIGGSVAFAAVARAVFFVSRDKDDNDRRLFTNPKMSGAKEADSRAYRMVGVQPRGARLQWEPDPVEITAADAMKEETPQSKHTKKAEATEWLKDFLRDGKKAHRDVLAAAMEMGYSKSTVDRAKKAARVISRDERGERGEILGHFWYLPQPKEAK